MKSANRLYHYAYAKPAPLPPWPYAAHVWAEDHTRNGARHAQNTDEACAQDVVWTSDALATDVDKQNGI